MRALLGAFFCLLVISSCDPVKRAIKRQERLDAAISEYLTRYPPKTDTVYVAGDTIYQFDTIVNENIYSDTIKVDDTVFVHHVKFKDVLRTIRVVDTIFYRISNDQGARAINNQLIAMEQKYKMANQQKNRFLVALIIITGLAILYISYKLFR